MSALGHTMASMSTDANGKYNKQLNSTNNRNKAPSRNSSLTHNSSNNNNNNKRGGQNITHLLSFTLPPRSRPPPPTSRRSTRAGGGVPFNKERYVNAQYRFLVKPTGDYTAYFADPDIYLNWSDILQVIIPTTSVLAAVDSSALSSSDQPSHATLQGAACPICLSPPTAPRMTKCGHVFCYPCILHYLTLSDNKDGSRGSSSSQKWEKCPICCDAVYARDLKAVRWWDPRAMARQQETKLTQARNLQEATESSQDEASSDQNSTRPNNFTDQGETLLLRLIERPHLTTLALPQSLTWPTSNRDHPLIPLHSAPWHFQPDVMGFAKFMLATPQLLIESLSNDLTELDSEILTLRSFGSSQLDLEFVHLAQAKVKEQMTKVEIQLDTPLIRSTIGQIKNDLNDYQAIQNSANRQSQSIRRPPKRLEKGDDHESEQVNPQQSSNQDRNLDHSPVDKEVSKDSDYGKPDQAVGAQEFLALRSQSHGGIITPNNSQQRETSASTDQQGGRKQDGSNKTMMAEEANLSRASRHRKNINPPAPESSTYLFFQAASGQNIFLHPLDIKILLSQFGSYSQLPRDLSVKVSGTDEGSMNYELGRRCKYLNHIPMATDVVFVEVDWQNMSIVSKSTLKPYEQALRQRKEKRKEKQRREDRAKTKADEAEINSTLGGAAAAASRQQRKQSSVFDSEAHFPSDGLSRGYENTGQEGYYQDARTSELSVSPTAAFGGDGLSPMFRQAALWGAEREFPIHPGAALLEDFPDSLGMAKNASIDGTSQHGDNNRSKHTVPVKKTVWGTAAAKTSSFSDVLDGGSRSNEANNIWGESADDAWHELEEDFILGSTGSGRRPSGAIKEKRGLNSQTGYHHSKESATADSVGSASGSQTPNTQSDSASATGRQPVFSKTKKVKTKLILTGGGGGRGTR